MKITALIPDELMNDVKDLTQGKNTTEALIMALSDWVKQKNLLKLNKKLKKTPLSFQKSYSSSLARERSRRK